MCVFVCLEMQGLVLKMALRSQRYFVIRAWIWKTPNLKGLRLLITIATMCAFFFLIFIFTPDIIECERAFFVEFGILRKIFRFNI